jgi:hypothetical protein
MTFDERVRALEYLGFSQSQTHFMMTVAVHSGFCLRRHYAKLSGLTSGASRLPNWRIIAVLPGHVAGRPASEAAFVSAQTAPRLHWSPASQDDLRFVFRIRDMADRKDLRDVTMDDIRKYHQIRARYDAKTIERFRLRWRATGDAAFECGPLRGFQAAVAAGRGRFETRRLPIRYDHFGTRAGVS